MADEPWDPKKHGDVVTPPPAAATAPAVAPTEVPYDPKKFGDVLSQPDQYGVHDVGQTVSSERAIGPRGIVPFANDVVRNVAEGATFGTADKFAAYMDSLFGKGSYDELLAKQRQETQESGGRLGPVGTFLAQAGGGMLTGSALARYGATLLGRLPATASLPMKILAGSGEGSLYGAASGLFHTDTGDVKDYLRNTAVGGLLGAVTGGTVTGALGGAQKGITPFATTDPVRAQAMQTLVKEGVDVSAGVKTGSPKLRMAEDVVSKMPLGGPMPSEQMAQVTQAVMRKAGIGGGGAATPDVLDKGFDAVGGKIGAISDQYHTGIDNQALTEAMNVAQKLPLLKPDQQGIVQHFLDKIVGSQTLPNGQRILGGNTSLTPAEAQALRTQLVQAIRDENGVNGNKALQRSLGDVKDMLDDALKRTIQGAGNDAQVTELQAARNQYAHLHILADALGSSGAAGMRGELTPSALASAVQRSVGKKDFFSGAGDLNDLARASAGYLQRPPDSGTATREGYQNPAKWGIGVAGRLGLNNSIMQKYWGNQAMPAPSGAQLQPAVPGLVSGTNPQQLGPADHLLQSLTGGLVGPAGGR